MTIYTDDADLEGLWRGDNDLTDESANANDLIASGTVSYDAGDKQQGTHSISLPSSPSGYAYIDDGDQVGLDPVSEFSFGCWVKAADSGLADKELISKYEAVAGQRSYSLFVTYDDVQLWYSTDGATYTNLKGTSNPFADNTWAHVVIVKEAATIRVYINGSELTDAPFPYSTADAWYDGSAPFKIGKSPNAWLMDEVFVFSRALSAADVADIHANSIQDPPAGGGQPTQLRGTTVPRLGRQWQPGCAIRGCATAGVWRPLNTGQIAASVL